MIEIEGKYIVIKTDIGYDYDIALSQIDTKEKLNTWIYHMQEKSWWDKYLTDCLIKICINRFGYKYAD